MSETGDQPQPTPVVEQKQRGEDPYSLSFATHEFFRNREFRNAMLKIISPTFVGAVGAVLSLFTGNPELAVSSLLIGAGVTGITGAYQTTKATNPELIGFIRGKNDLSGRPYSKGSTEETEQTKESAGADSLPQVNDATNNHE